MNAPLARPISVDEVLSAQEFTETDFQVVAGSQGLNREVKRAHVLSGVSAISLLEGGELVLTTGEGWPEDDHEVTTLLIRHNPAAIVIELGTRFIRPPRNLVHLCSSASIPLVVLKRQVKFALMTERVHRLVVESREQALAARAEIHDMLTELGIKRSPVDYIVERLAEALESTVILEDLGNRAVTWARGGNRKDNNTTSPGEMETPFHVLEPWASGTGGPIAVDPSWVRVPVEARGTRWGFLTALEGPEHPAGRKTVLELGALALALGRLSDWEGETWLETGSRIALRRILGGRYKRDDDITTQLAALGFRIGTRPVIGGSLTFRSDPQFFPRVLSRLLERGLTATMPHGTDFIIAPDEQSQGCVFAVSEPTSSIAETSTWLRLGNHLNNLLAEANVHPDGAVADLNLGPTGVGFTGLVRSLDLVTRARHSTVGEQVGLVGVTVSDGLSLDVLIRQFASTVEMQEFSNGWLAPILEYDSSRAATRSVDLMHILRAHIAHPTNKSAAAAAANLSRSVFYERMEQIESLLGRDLDDGAVIAALAVASALHTMRSQS